MSDELPAPLVPPEVDLRDFGFMPLDVRRLLTSETWIEAADDPRLGHALMSLWAEAWHQVPAASLPDNDRVLQRLSMCPSAKEWARVKQRSLAGWVKCSDGLLYHPVVAEKAMESWAKKLAQRERTKAASEARERKRRERDDHRHDARNDQRNDQRDVKRNDQRNEDRDVHQGRVKGQGQGITSVANATAGKPAKAPDPVKDEIWRTGRSLLEKQGLSKDAAGSFLGGLCKEYGQVLVITAVRDADRERPAEVKAWLTARCQERRANAGNRQLALEERARQAADIAAGGPNARI